MEKVLAYIMLDSRGNMTETLIGKNIIPSKTYTCFFHTYDYIAFNLKNYDVIYNNASGNYELQVIDVALEEQHKKEYGYETEAERLEREYQEKLKELEALKQQMEQK